MLLFLLLAGCTAAAGAQVRFEKLTMTEACAEARRSGKLLFVDLYASWCPPCRMMDKQVFPRHDVGALLAEHCVCVKFDIDRPEGRELARHYGVAAVPTYLICTADGEPLGRIAGAVDAPQFAKDVRTLLGRHRKASGGRTLRRRDLRRGRPTHRTPHPAAAVRRCRSGKGFRAPPLRRAGCRPPFRFEKLLVEEARCRRGSTGVPSRPAPRPGRRP